jgi:diacylglycerol kinase
MFGQIYDHQPMNYTQSNLTLGATPVPLRKSGSALGTILKHDPSLVLQLLLTLPVIFGGILLHLNAAQWILVGFVTFLYLGAVVMRTAAILQTKVDSSLTLFHIRRIKAMGNAILSITAGISMITYMLVFVPLILPLI